MTSTVTVFCVHACPLTLEVIKTNQQLKYNQTRVLLSNRCTHVTAGCFQCLPSKVAGQKISSSQLNVSNLHCRCVMARSQLWISLNSLLSKVLVVCGTTHLLAAYIQCIQSQSSVVSCCCFRFEFVVVVVPCFKLITDITADSAVWVVRFFV